MAVLTLCPSSQSSAQVAKLLPVDEASRVPEFFVFRSRLLTALARHDAAAVMSVVSPTIRNDFGGDDGSAAFRRIWKLDDAGSPLWGELTAILGLGGTFESESTFVAPYVFGRFPKDLDAIDYLAVIGSCVRVRKQPSAAAEALAVLSFDVVRRGRKPEQAPPGWTAVELKDGRMGFVASRYLRSQTSYRAYFVRTAGRWQMITLVAGD